MKKLTMEELEQVTGGVIVDIGEDVLYIVRQDGTVVGPAPKEMAESFAKTLSVSTEIITGEDYQKRFGRPFQW